MNIEEETSKRWDRLIESGALVKTGGTDEEPEYHFDLDRLQEVDPEFYQIYMDDLDNMLLNMHTQGLIDLHFEGEEIQASLTDKGENLAEAIRNLGIS